MAWPLTPLDVTGEICIGGSVGWVDITADMRLTSAASGGGVSISRQLPAGGSLADPGKMSLTLDNRTGKYSPRNPRGPWYGLFGRNTPIRVGVEYTKDSFTRTVANGWGTSEGNTPLPWGLLAGAAADFSVSGGVGKHSHPTINVVRGQRLSRNWADVEQYSEISIPAVATGASIVAGHFARHQTDPGTGEFYWTRLEFDVGGQISVKISQTLTEIAAITGVPGLSYTAGQVWSVRSSCVGNRIRIKAWPTGTVEPRDWTLSVVDDQIKVPGRAGTMSWVVAGNTNASRDISYDNYKAIDRRFFGEVTSWPQKWDTGGFDRWVPIEASGILRRLNQGKQPQRSSLSRTIPLSSPVAYWPIEDSMAASMAGSSLADVPAMIGSGTIDFVVAEDRTFGNNPTLRYGLSKLANLAAGGSLSANIGSAAATATQWSIMVMADPDATQAPGDIVVARVETPGGTYVRWDLVIRKATLHTQIVAYDASGGATTVIDDNGVLAALAHYDFGVWQSGGNISVGYSWRDSDSTYIFTGSIAGTLTGVRAVSLNPTRQTQSTAMTFGHLAIWSAQHVPVKEYLTDSYGGLVYGAPYSWLGETAVDRLKRLCAEEGIPLSVPAVPGHSYTRMGWQPVATTADLIRQCVDADGGLLFESRESLGLVYRPRFSLYSQTPLVLSYSGGHISPPFEPVEDDDLTFNDVTVSRSDGSSVRAVDSGSRLAATPPPNGIGVYDTSVELNLLADSQLRDQAYWRLHLWTVDEARYQTITADLSATAWVADPALASRATAVDAGDLVSIGGLPTWLPPGPVKTLARGVTEALDSFDWNITWTADPGSPWDVGIADKVGRVGATGATLTSSVTSGATSISVTTPVVNGPWTTNVAHFPFDIRIGAERVTVSAISGAGSVQTFTLSARGVNGLQQAWPAGTEVQVWDLCYVGL